MELLSKLKTCPLAIDLEGNFFCNFLLTIHYFVYYVLVNTSAKYSFYKTLRKREYNAIVIKADILD
ncbi:hypothetical protein BCD64_26850 [Nostoc sp. MBR 210]|nr:hypothetical protein BCD64_26850 [Nostoc sp. MBR 210]